MPPSLLVSAVATLEDPASTPALKAAATEALVAALGEGLPIPSKGPWLIWSWLKTLPASRSWGAAGKLGVLEAPDVRADALRVLDTDDAGDDLRSLAVELLGGDAHAAHVSNEVIMGLVDRAQRPEQVRLLPPLLEAVHRARGLPSSFLRTVRDRWATSPSPAVREASVDLDAELVGSDVTFLETLLGDCNANVRCAVAHRLERGLPAGEPALGLVEARLRVEEHPDVCGALLRTQAALLEERRPRRFGRRR